MDSSSLLDAIKSGGSTLRSVPENDRSDRSAANPKLLAIGELDAKQETETRDYFFDAGVDTWYKFIEDLTPSTSFCDLQPEEARIIVEHWKQQTTGDVAVQRSQQQSELVLFDRDIMGKTKNMLQALQERLEDAIKSEVTKSPVSLAFVKLSTRSPKDSKLVLSTAASRYQERYQDLSEREVVSSNTKWVMLSEEVAAASAIDNASLALDILLDSYRVYEDLEYALEGLENGTSAWNVSLVARAWDPRIKPDTEFRAVCWNGKMTCLCQYFHPLYFPSIVSDIGSIQKDILNCFNDERVQEALSRLGGHCIIDFARVASGEVVIVELNPFDGVGLGTFPASTGLFLWDDPVDNRIMQGIDPFEFRVRQEPLPEKELTVGFHRAWRSIILNSSK